VFADLVSQFQGTTNPLYRLRAEIEARGETILELVSGNVNEHGILFPQELLEKILVQASRRCTIYRPDSFGHASARAAIAAYYQSHGVNVPSGRILLTPGTSVSYWYCFKLLANVGDEILCPSPSYPLFDYIAALCGARLVPYRLRETRGWSIDIDELEACLSTRSRALILISPHNPTGHVASAEEIGALSEIALRHDLAIISDEVFSEFLLREKEFARPAATQAPLVFTLNGFSKMFALPGIKVGWMALSGSEDRVRQAARALELISDTFLPVNEYAQASVAAILDQGQEFLQRYVSEIRERWMVAKKLLARSSRITAVDPDGGFYVTLGLQDLDEGAAAESLLRQHHLLVHPGYFYDITPHHLVLSFVLQPEVLEDSLSRIISAIEKMP
jgi:aspartate/methionine/tyrosine aminotransferase